MKKVEYIVPHWDSINQKMEYYTDWYFEVEPDPVQHPVQPDMGITPPDEPSKTNHNILDQSANPKTNNET